LSVRFHTETGGGSGNRMPLLCFSQPGIWTAEKDLAMTPDTAFPMTRSRPSLALLLLLMVPLSAYPQTTLTGAIQFSTNSIGAFYDGQIWDTLGGDYWWDLWLARNPDATSPVNGPSDAQAGIAIPLESGNAYKYYIFSEPSGTFSFVGLNLFFDGNNSAPGISVFSAVNSPNFAPSASTSLTLQGTSAAGAGSASYSSGGVVVVLNGFDWYGRDSTRRRVPRLSLHAFAW
jgi:hypothetical protein